MTVVGVTGRIDGPLHPRLGGNPHSRLRWLILGGGRQGSMSSFGFRRPIVDVEWARDVEYMPGPLMSARRAVARQATDAAGAQPAPVSGARAAESESCDRRAPRCR